MPAPTVMVTGVPVPRLSVVVVAYEMARELPRTLRSLSLDHQRGLAEADYELIVVDNGSPTPVNPSVLDQVGVASQLLRIDDAPPSPVGAVNRGLRAARADLIGVFIDGARIASPGLLATALLGATLAPRPVVAALGWHLGDEAHMRAAQTGHDAAREDRLLDSIGWPNNGERLFEISVLAGSSARGWFGPLGESNSLFLTSQCWNELGGMDERFVSPGGGRANSDVYHRALGLDGAQPVVLLGEGTFHQIHGGAATSGGSARHAADEEYRRIRGVEWSPPNIDPIYVGRVPDAALPDLEQSVRWAVRHRGG